MGLLQKIISRTLDKDWLNDCFVDAVCENKPKLARFIGGCGVDMNAVCRHGCADGESVGYYSLEVAAEKGSLELGKFIVEEMGYRDQRGLERALQMVEGEKVEAFIDLLVDNGGSVHAWDNTVLELALEECNFRKAAHLVFRHGAKPDDISAEARSIALEDGPPELKAFVRLLPWNPNNRYYSCDTGF